MGKVGSGVVYVVEKNEKKDVKKNEHISWSENAIFPEGVPPGNIVHVAIYLAAWTNVSNYVDIGLNKEHINVIKNPSYTS